MWMIIVLDELVLVSALAFGSRFDQISQCTLFRWKYVLIGLAQFLL